MAIRAKVRIITASLAILLSAVLLAIPGRADDSGRKLESKVAPVYPQLARQFALSGSVKLELTVEAGGKVKSVRVLGGNPVLAMSATEAAKKWKYAAGPKETTEVVEFKFSGN